MVKVKYLNSVLLTFYMELLRVTLEWNLLSYCATKDVVNMHWAAYMIIKCIILNYMISQKVSKRYDYFLSHKVLFFLVCILCFIGNEVTVGRTDASAIADRPRRIRVVPETQTIVPV